jgi:cell division protein FtsQ
MLILSGKGANINAKSIFNIFAIDPNLSSNVYSATWISNRRWDIRFENGLLVKLPEDNISDAWKRLIKINNMPGSILGLKIIDLRLGDKVYLEYNDSMIKELKSL